MSITSTFKKLSVLFLICLLAVFMQPLASVVLPISSQTGASTQKSYNPGYLHVKFSESADVVLSNQKFVSPGLDLSQVNEFLEGKANGKARLFSGQPEAVSKKRVQIKKLRGKNTPNLNNYFRIRLNGGLDSKAVSAQLKALPAVVEAYAEPTPAPTPARPSKKPSPTSATPDFTTQQTYLGDGGNGMGITSGKNFPAANGSLVNVADLEYSWNTGHEDISKSRQSGSLINNGSPVDPFSNTNHGTAVNGIVSGDINGYGIEGIASGANLKLVNTYSTDKGWNIADAIYLASSSLDAGDVILVEQQTWGPVSGTFVPVEWIPAVYDSIVFATAAGNIVIQPAANSGLNLDDPIYGSNFPSGKPSSGAIIVGAGAACGSSPHRSRLQFSNYGSRVNVQGNGECVVTSGYGSLYSGADQNSWYTATFNGTSSASALVAAVTASISSSYEYVFGVPATPEYIMQILINSGKAQDASVNTGNIGPLPNLYSAQRLLDTAPPSTPSNLQASLAKRSNVALSWNPSTDNSKVIGYLIYRNGNYLTTVTGTSYTDSSVQSRTSYSYYVIAVDAVGLTSQPSNTATIQTK